MHRSVYLYPYIYIYIVKMFEFLLCIHIYTYTRSHIHTHIHTYIIIDSYMHAYICCAISLGLVNPQLVDPDPTGRDLDDLQRPWRDMNL